MVRAATYVYLNSVSKTQVCDFLKVAKHFFLVVISTYKHSIVLLIDSKLSFLDQLFACLAGTIYSANHIRRISNFCGFSSTLMKCLSSNEKYKFVIFFL